MTIYEGCLKNVDFKTSAHNEYVLEFNVPSIALWKTSNLGVSDLLVALNVDFDSKIDWLKFQGV